MTTPNVLLSIDDHVIDALAEVRAEAEDLMDRYADAKRRESEPEALAQLRRSQGAALRGAVSGTVGVSALRSA